jgi:hypothetical protein
MLEYRGRGISVDGMLKNDQIGIAQKRLFSRNIDKEIGIQFVKITKVNMWQAADGGAEGTVYQRPLDVEMRKIHHDV